VPRFITYVSCSADVRYESGHFLPPRKKLAHSNTYSSFRERLREARDKCSVAKVANFKKVAIILKV
jgi:hypothetical protein